MIMKMRVASYNIQHGAFVDMKMQTLADDFEALALDVVGLQEVDIHVDRSRRIDTMAELAEASSLKYTAFSKSIPLGGGVYGNGILSRWPILSFESVMLESGGFEQRSVAHALLDVCGQPVHFFNTHLTLSREDAAIRTRQFAELAGLLPKKEPYILTGDFNTENFQEFNVLNAAWMLNRTDRRYPSLWKSSKAIDNILFSDGWKLEDSGMLEEKHSDHYMIWCQVSRQSGEF